VSKKYDIDNLVERFNQGDKFALARLISLVENEPEKAPEVFKHFHNKHHNSYIIGLTGSPGVGKSTITNAITKRLLKEGKKVGIISVDPSSPFSGGAFLGDRVRMTEISLDPNVFIRSLGSRGYRGGLSRAVLDVSLLYEAYGMDVIIIETVGVGQSEFEIYNLAYTIIVLMVPGYGDQIQMEKAGILEIGDIYVVNKKDLGGDDVAAQVDLMLDDACYETGWRPPVLMTNAITAEGIDELIEYINDHEEHLKLSESINEKKKERFAYKLKELISFKIETILKTIITEDEVERITKEIIAKGKFKIYDIVFNIFNEINFNI